MELELKRQTQNFSPKLLSQLSRVRLFGTPWTAAPQASLSITNSRSLLKLMSIESVMPSNQLILCRLLLLPPSIFPSIKVFSKESGLCTVPETIYSAVEFKKTSDFFLLCEIQKLF